MLGECIGPDIDEMIIARIMVPDQDVSRVESLPLKGPVQLRFDREISAYVFELTQPTDVIMVAALLDQTWGRS